jgi:hypothetical protein
MVLCSGKKKQICIDTPDCNWVTGKGCKSSISNSPKPRKTSTGCTGIKKDICLTKDNCTWVVGKGCKPGVTIKSKSLSRVPSVRSSPVNVPKVKKTSTGCTGVKKSVCLTKDNCTWVVGKGCKPGVTIKSKSLSRVPSVRSSPVNVPKVKKTSTGCSGVKKSVCLTKDNCTWVVGKGCKPGVTIKSKSLNNKIVPYKSVTPKTVSYNDNFKSKSDIKTHSFRKINRSYNDDENDENNENNNSNDDYSYSRIRFTAEFYFNKERINFNVDLRPIKSEEDYKQRVQKLKNEKYIHRLDHVYDRTMKELLEEADMFQRKYGYTSKVKAVLNKLSKEKQKEFLKEYNSIVKAYEEKRKYYFKRLNTLYIAFKKDKSPVDAEKKFEEEDYSYNSADRFYNKRNENNSPYSPYNMNENYDFNESLNSSVNNSSLNSALDASKWYCVKPYNKKNAPTKKRVKSCARGKNPHSNFKEYAYDNMQSCTEKCFYE